MADDNPIVNALNTFSQGLGRFAQAQAIRSANKEVEQIRSQITNQQEQQEALQSVANNFVSRFTQAGGSASSANSFVNTLQPKTQQAKPFTNRLDVLTRGSEEDIKRLREDEEQQFQRQLQLIAKRTEAVARTKPEKLTKGQETIDREAGKTAAKFITGGKRRAETNIGRLEDAINKIDPERGEGVEASGGILGKLEGALGSTFGAPVRAVRTLFNAEGVAVQEDIERVVQDSLRESLGAQFTEAEGKRLLERTFNPALDEKENARRARLLIEEMRDIVQQKERVVRELRQQGTLKNFDFEELERQQIKRINDLADGFDSNDTRASEPEQRVVESTSRIRRRR